MNNTRKSRSPSLKRKRAVPRLKIDQLAPHVKWVSLHKFLKGDQFHYMVPAHHFLLIESGRIQAQSPYGSCSAVAGDLVYFQPSEWAEYCFEEATVFYQVLLTFAPPPLEGALLDLDPYGPIPMHLALGTHFETMKSVFETICLEITRTEPSHQLRVRASAFEMLSLIAKVMSADDGNLGVSHLDNWEHLLLKLENAPDVNIDFDALAADMNLSRAYFDRAFKRHLGISPKNYQVQTRLCKATDLLRKTDKLVKEIACELGFPSPKIFSRMFKHYFGVTPLDVRHGMVPDEFFSFPRKCPPFRTNVLLKPDSEDIDWIKQCEVRYSSGSVMH